MFASRILLTLCLLLATNLSAASDRKADVVVYGATPSGIAAAIAAAKGGHDVLLIEPTSRIGGMTTNGLSHPDFRTFEAITGTYLELTRRAFAYYEDKYGKDSKQVRDSFRGTHAEPKVNLMLFHEMLAEHPNIAVQTEWRLEDGMHRGPAGDRWLRAIRLSDAIGQEKVVEGMVFIDATYEGDLIAAAQIPYRIGEESRDEYGEPAAPEEGSGRLQGYNFRLIMTRDPEIRVPIEKPKGYEREIFDGLLPLLENGAIERVFGGYGDKKSILKAQIPRLPNNKFDVNDASGPVRMSLPGEQLLWPEGDEAARQEIFEEHLLWNVGIIYFLQHDFAVPERFRQEALEWGFCKDEFVDSEHLPQQLYVREARRMVGLRVFTQNDMRLAEGDARAALHRDAVAMGDYGPSSHGTWHEGSRFGGERRGQFALGRFEIAPYQIPFGTIAAKDVRNVLAPVPASASHVGFCSLRLEHIWTSLGQAAGHAAGLALQARHDEPDARTVPIEELQKRLWDDGSATIYVSDVLPGHPDFVAVQWWGTAGGLHGLAERPERPRGPTIEGQHSEAWRNHEAGLDLVLEEGLAKRWRGLASEFGLEPSRLPVADGRATRGDWIRAAYALEKE